MTINIIIAFGACLLGIACSLYIFLKKIRHDKLICPREHPCDSVLHSRFSKTFGIPNEILGIFYFLSVGTILMIPCSGMVTSWLLYILFFMLIIGLLFSIYLVMAQILIIRSWCFWCAGIALSNLILFISLSSIPIAQFDFILASQKVMWVIVHSIGFILGIGAATITDILFFRFLKDGKISQEEKDTMDTLSSVIWVGLAILIVSGIALFIPEASKLAVSSKFLLKVVVVSVIILNGLILNMFVAPHIRRLSFAEDKISRRFRRIAFALGGISITSWYLAFILGSLRSISTDFITAVVLYGVLLSCVVIGSRIFENHLSKNKEVSALD